MKKMSTTEKNKSIYNYIYTISGLILVFIIEIYLQLCANGIKLFTVPGYENKVVNILIEFCIHWIVFSGMYILIYKIVSILTAQIWIRKNKNIWIAGTWLHIHEKDKVRVGIVKIEQDYYNIKAQAMNMDPTKNDKLSDFTTWSYCMAQVNHVTEDVGRGFSGFYYAYKNNKGEKNYGIHRLTIICNKTGYPSFLHGNFYDTFKIKSNVINSANANEHCGALSFFKPSKQCLQYLISGGSEMDRLKELLYQPDFSNEPYVRELKNVLKKHNKL